MGRAGRRSRRSDHSGLRVPLLCQPDFGGVRLLCDHSDIPFISRGPSHPSSSRGNLRAVGGIRVRRRFFIIGASLLPGCGRSEVDSGDGLDGSGDASSGFNASDLGGSGDSLDSGGFDESTSEGDPHRSRGVWDSASVGPLNNGAVWGSASINYSPTVWGSA